jgi:hypothetical protein
MKVKEFLDLQDAYKGVYENQQLDEIDSSIIARTAHKRAQNLDAAQKKEMGARDVGASAEEQSKRGAETSDAAAKVSKHRALSSAHARSRARMNNEEVENWVDSLIEDGYDLYDIILSHLIDEGYAETEDAAESIMVNMSEEWREQILDEAITSEKGKAKAARRAGTYTESFNIFVNSMIAEGVSMEQYTWEEIQNVFDDLFEAEVANRNPDEYERKAKQGQSREQQLKGRVMGRMSQMDPDKKAAMLKQMKAVGLDV